MSELFRRSWLVLMFSTAALAQPLTEQAAVDATLRGNATLRAAMTDAKQSAENVRAESARYRPRLLLDGTGTTQQTPNLNTSGGTTTQSSQSLVFGAELAQTFSFGTTLDLRVENRITRSSGPLFGGSTDLFTLGPGYGLSARLSVTQPLLRGFGDEVGLAALRTELLNRKESERARDGTASESLSATLQAYWELWYAQRALGIQQEAREFAKQQVDEARRKVSAGSAADFDVLTWETRLAELEQNVLSAQVNVTQRTVELRRAVGEGGSLAALDVSASTPPALRPVDGEAVLQQAQQASYSIARLQLSLERAETTLRSAADATRPRLDAQAWVQTQGLGNQSYEGTFQQLGAFSNVSGNVGLTFELPLSGEQHEAQLGAARLAVTAARERLEAARQQALADTQVELSTLSQAVQNITLAETSAEVSERSAEAQRRRLKNGAATSLEVREAEDALRRARLSVERERINAVKAQVRLAHLTGNLLPTWSSR